MDRRIKDKVKNFQKIFHQLIFKNEMKLYRFFKTSNIYMIKTLKNLSKCVKCKKIIKIRYLKVFLKLRINFQMSCK